MIQSRWLLVFAPWLAWGSVSETMRWEWESGYRNDRLHWHLSGDGDPTYSEHDRDLRFWENDLTLRVIYRDIALFARGSFAALGHGDMRQTWAHLSYTSDSPSHSWHSDAWGLDGWGYFGYAVNLTADRTYQVILIPIVGYGAETEHLEPSGSKTGTGTAVAPAESYSMTCQLPGKERMTWFGPLFGGLFIIRPGGSLRFEAGYAYHRLHLRFTSKRQTEVSLFGAGSALLSETTTQDKIKVKDGANLAHTGWARADYEISNAWRSGLEVQIKYFCSRILNASIKNETAHTSSSQKFKARWMSVSGAISISRTF
ncbi:MAG: Pom protein [Parachlamydiales bacterium]|nr:Pom protein [Parachlamydiales bacterium]